MHTIVARWAVFLLSLAGFLALAGINPLDAVRPNVWKAQLQALLARLRARGRKSLRRRVQQVQGKEKPNFFDRNVADTKRILLSTNQQGKIRLVSRLSALCFCAGLLASLAMRNILMLPVLSVGFSLIPMWFVRYNEFYYKKQLCNELEVALSVITSSYLRTDDLVRSVEDNLSYLNEPVRSPFAKFANGVRFVDANLQNGIRTLRAAIDNAVFRDWCDILLLCAVDRTYKHSLPPVVEQFSDNKSLQGSLETMIQMPVREYNTIIGIVLVTIPIIFLLNKDWFFTLVGTWGGKAILTGLSVLLFAGMNKAIGLSSPID